MEEKFCKTCPYKGESIFSSLSDTLLDEFCHKKMDSHYSKDQRIFYEGEPNLGIFILCSGRVKLSRSSKRGRRQIIGIKNPCGLLEEKDLFLEGRHTVTAEAMEDCVVGFVKKDDFLNLQRNNPSISLRMISQLSRELEEAEEKIEALTESNIKQRLADLLLRLAAAYGKETAHGTLIEIILTREEIAEMVGTTGESVIRTLSDFKKEKMIREIEKQIFLLDKIRLISLAGR